MKKKVSLFLLLIAVTMGTAFAETQIGDSLPFTQFSGASLVKVVSVWATKSGIEIEYEGLGNVSKAVFSALISNGHDQLGSNGNTERFIKQGKTYRVKLKVSGWNLNNDIKSVSVSVDTGNTSKSTTPYKDSNKKKDMIDRMFPPLKLN